MKSSVNQDLEFETTRAGKFHPITKGVMNSRYKRIVKYNFKKACKKSVFGVRKRTKFLKLCKLGHATTVTLKVSVFVAAAILFLV